MLLERRCLLKRDYEFWKIKQMQRSTFALMQHGEAKIKQQDSDGQFKTRGREPPSKATRSESTRHSLQRVSPCVKPFSCVRKWK